MNREQWQKKRSHVAAGTPSAALVSRGLPFVKDSPGDSGQTFAAIREQHFDDGLASDAWVRLARSNDDSGGDSH